MTERKPATDPVVTADVALGNVAEDRLVEVRTTMRPDQPMRVSRAEADDLEAQNLLVKDTTKKGAGTDAR